MGQKLIIKSIKFLINKFFTIIALNLAFVTQINANDQIAQLNKLFSELKINDVFLAQEVEKKIWKIWSTHPKNKELTLMLDKGSNFVNNKQLIKAVDVFTQVINLDPSWAEAWNKRATVLYMMGDFQRSQDDIDKVLELEERHFGALAGQGLVNIQLKNYEKAIMSYKKVKEIYPAMQSPDIMIKQIEGLIRSNSI